MSVGLLGRESEVATGQRWAQSIERNKAVPDVGAYDEHQRGREGNRYHPMVGAVAGSHDVVHSRQRGGTANSGWEAASFLTESFNRVRTAGASGPLTLRADSGFYNHKVVDALSLS